MLKPFVTKPASREYTIHALIQANTCFVEYSWLSHVG